MSNPLPIEAALQELPPDAAADGHGLAINALLGQLPFLRKAPLVFLLLLGLHTRLVLRHGFVPSKHVLRDLERGQHCVGVHGKTCGAGPCEGKSV